MAHGMHLMDKEMNNMPARQFLNGRCCSTDMRVEVRDVSAV